MPDTTTPPTGEPDDAPAEDVAPEVPVFANRAERRAKGKGKSVQAQQPGRGQVSGSRGPVQSQRQWSNRRSGG